MLLAVCCVVVAVLVFVCWCLTLAVCVMCCLLCDVWCFFLFCFFRLSGVYRVFEVCCLLFGVCCLLIVDCCALIHVCGSLCVG